LTGNNKQQQSKDKATMDIIEKIKKHEIKIETVMKAYAIAFACKEKEMTHKAALKALMEII